VNDCELTVSIVTYKTNMDHVRKSVHDILMACASVYIIIADNDSGTDYFSNLQKEFSEADHVRVVSTGANKGYGYGHNYAIGCCPASSLHLVMNADIEIEAVSLHKMLQFMALNSDVGLLVPKIVFPDGSLQPLNKRAPTLLDMLLRFLSSKLDFIGAVRKRLAYYEMKDVGYEAKVEVPYASGCFMMFRRKDFERIGGFDESFFMYLEDADITRRIAEVARVLYFPDSFVVHNWSRGSYKSMRLFLIMLHSIGVYFNKWGWKLF